MQTVTVKEQLRIVETVRAKALIKCFGTYAHWLTRKQRLVIVLIKISCDETLENAQILLYS